MVSTFSTTFHNNDDHISYKLKNEHHAGISMSMQLVIVNGQLPENRKLEEHRISYPILFPIFHH